MHPPNPDPFIGVSLRVYHRSRSVAELIDLLGIAPHESVELGQQLDGAGAAKKTGWFWQSHSMSASTVFREHLDAALEFIRLHAEGLLRARESGCKIDLAVFKHAPPSGGAYLTVRDLRILADLEIPIWFFVSEWEVPPRQI